MEVITETVTAKDTQIDITVTTTESKPEFKSFYVKAPDVELKDNHFRGVPSVMGNVDEGGDVIFPGAFKEAIDGFLSAGFVPLGHDWYDKPVAMPTKAYEEGNKLIAEAEFHSTPSAQEAKTIVKERLERGLDVGLSIGFDIAPGGAQMFESGEKLLEFAGEKKADMKLFDVAGIKAVKSSIRAITKIRRLFEFSIVSVPMNPLAVATAAKVLATDDFKDFAKLQDFEGFLRDAGFSQKAAKQFVSAFKATLQRDAGGDPITPEPPGPITSEMPVEEKSEPVVTPTSPESAPLLFGTDGRVYPAWILKPS
jgi:hypothetical protein